MNIVSNILYKLGDAAACGATEDQFDRILQEEFHQNHRNLEDLQQDIRQMKEVIGYLGKRLSSLEQPQQPSKAKIISMP